MPTVLFDSRPTFDRHFYEDIKTGKLTTTPRMLIKLMYINDKAKGHSRTHNLMSRKVFDSILKTNLKMYRSVLRASFYPNEKEDLEEIEDEIERTIKIAIDSLDEPPNKALIFTSEEKLDEYKNNNHFKGVKGIDVKASQEAMKILDSYFNLCRR